MLNAPAPFPHIGSYALFEDGGHTHLVRIQQRLERFGEPHALISIARTRRAGGTKLVKVAELLDGTPLAAEEADEQIALYAKNGAARRKRAADVARYDALRLRGIRAVVLQSKLASAGLDRIAA